MPLTEVTREGREGFEIYTLVLCVLGGPPIIFGDATPGTIQALLPHQWQLVWGLMICLGSLIALIGIFLPRRDTGLIIEQIGMVATGVGMLAYAAAVLDAAGWSGFFPAIAVTGFGLACFRRWWRIQKALKKAEVLAQRRQRGFGNRGH
jgi:hypothetical protein